jgi:putative peptide zinc metalloprotease protein
MAESMFSSSWYRVASLKPRLRSHAQIHRHHYRGQLWYVLQDTLAGRYHRFTPAAHYLISLMDGQRTVQTIWTLAVEHLGDDAPTQEEMIRLMGQLHASDLLVCDVSPDSLELFRRFQRQERQQWLQRLWSPLSLRFPLLDPDAFLNRWQFLVSPLFGWFGALIWLAVVGAGVAMGSSHWADLTQNVTDQVLAPSNLLILFLVYPLIKLLHELGHAFATKVWGGEVHELGIMLIVFMPVPYVDASAASAFRSKRRRMVVGAAGMLVELFIASLALFVWLNVEPGLVRSVAYNVVLIGSVSTLFFNGNPLLRFDGYYIFADAVEIPNLASRANQYLGYCTQRYLFGLREAQTNAGTDGERIWLAVYGLASFGYRLFVTVSIALFVAGKFFVVGVLLAIWAAVTMVVVPLGKSVRFLLTSPAIEKRRARAISVSAGLLAMSLALLFGLPVPLYTQVEGVVWLPEQALVRAETSGFVRRLLVEPNTPVKAGDALLETEDALLTRHLEALEYRYRELEARYQAEWRNDYGKAQLIREEMASAHAELERTRERVANLTIRSREDGVFVVPKAEDLPGKWFKQGEVIAYVVRHPVTTVKAVVTQDRIGLMRQRVEGVDVRLAEDVGRIYAGRIVREVPAASDKLPSVALGQNGGGEIAVDPSDRHGDKAFETVFQFDVELSEQGGLRNLGGRVYVRFDHGDEPLARQGYRKLRQLFLRRFSV